MISDLLSHLLILFLEVFQIIFVVFIFEFFNIE